MSFTFVVSGSIILTREQATSETAFPDGPAVISAESGGGGQLLEPSTGPATGQEGITSTGEPTLVIDLHSGSILDVAISPSKPEVAAGAPVELKSTVTGQAPGETLSYAWTFGDGTGGSQSSVSHSYLVPGTYDVSLSVSGSDDSLGWATKIPITVGKAPAGPNRAGGGASKHRHAPTSGASVKGSGDTRLPRTSAVTTKANTGAAMRASRGVTPPGTTATPATSDKVPVALHHVPDRGAARPKGALLSGIPITAAQMRSARASATRPGAIDPARSGHLTAQNHGLWSALLILLATLATLGGGALLEWAGTPRMSSASHVP